MCWKISIEFSRDGVECSLILGVRPLKTPCWDASCRGAREDNSSGVSKSELPGIAGGLVTLGTRQYVSCLDVWVGLIKRVKAQSARYGS
jgi:hypothetical protein